MTTPVVAEVRGVNMEVAIVIGVAYVVVFIVASALIGLDKETEREVRRGVVVFATLTLGTGSAVGGSVAHLLWANPGLTALFEVVGFLCAVLFSLITFLVIEHRKKIGLVVAKVVKAAGKVATFPLWGPVQAVSRSVERAYGKTMTTPLMPAPEVEPCSFVGRARFRFGIFESLFTYSVY